MSTVPQSIRESGARRRALALLLAGVLAGCGDAAGDGPEPPAEPAATPAPTTAAAAPDAEPAGRPAIVSLSADPGGGDLLVGTGVGMYRVDPRTGRSRRLTGRLRSEAGAGAVSSNLVLRFSGPDTVIGSGHPEGETTLPEDLGLIESTDGGRTWRSVSLLGEADLHSLDVRGNVVVGQPVEEARLLVSADGGRTFAERTPPAAPTDVDLDPRDPERMLITTADGVYGSTDGGASWRQRDVLTVEAHLAWAPDGDVFRVDAGGPVSASEDGGRSWAPVGDAGGPPTTATVDHRGRLYVALAGAVITRSDDGGKTFERVAQLGG